MSQGAVLPAGRVFLYDIAVVNDRDLQMPNITAQNKPPVAKECRPWIGNVAYVCAYNLLLFCQNTARKIRSMLITKSSFPHMLVYFASNTFFH
jgi:hypothetical protein